ncbi:LPXTG cell wall anchor domain-containing protein [Microbacterium arborescens]|uniref:LPXTG cell wall anchor domain-containing protein n=1 Tax=Microbacterium arborescens TaxID=33883 RepID=UPI0025A24B3F|nr:LPXTG cell wall anchor domain-containing protein [Microbacterium arborescens]WJM16935.1 LPXTG cell wall anchor domain-containing protein [Microbacterium arborescens]
MHSSVISVVLLGSLSLLPTVSSTDATTYAPDDPSGATLAGSMVTTDCESDAPWISFDVVLTGGTVEEATAPVSLILDDGVNTTSVPLGSLQDYRLSGRMLWPGASVDDEGRGTGWPGWEFRDGTWTATDAGFAWTRGDIAATLRVNPDLAVPVAYPASTPDCATSPNGVRDAAVAALPATGGSASGPIALAVAAVGAFVAGALLVLQRRRHRRA